MSLDPRSVLRPLAARAADLDLLREGAPAAAPVVRVARAVEETLRRMLRDDPTAPLDVRLRALAADDLPSDSLIAELRRRDRLPLALAAAFHDLAAAAERIAAGEEPGAREAALAVSVAEEVARRVRAAAAHPPLEDPVTAERLADPLAAEAAVRPVPPPARRRRVWPWVLGAAVLLVLAAVLLRPRDGEARLREGEAAYRAGRMAEAEAAFRAVAEADPGAVLPRVYLARIYRESGRHEAAAGELRAALEAAPGDPRPHTELGFLLLDTGRPREAADRFRAALDLDPGAERAHGGRVRALRAAGLHAEAERALAEAPPRVRALLGGH